MNIRISIPYIQLYHISHICPPQYHIYVNDFVRFIVEEHRNILPVE